jgi:flagellar hook capping protein FlgD
VNTSEPRLQLLDPVGMSMSLFASTGSATYPAAATGAGTYSSPRSQAVILDYLSSCLRGFSLGTSGDGPRFAENLSGFLSRMVEIRAAGPVGMGDATSRPSLLRLDPVAPNPLGGAALVRFALPAPGRVRVTIHDLAGRLVRLLADETSEAGSRSLLWDGRDEQGRRVPPGPYFLRLDSNGATVGRKMMVLR